MPDERRSDVTASELFREREVPQRIIKQSKLPNGRSIEYSTEVIATAAEINAGRVILPAATGLSYLVTGIDLLCVGAAGGATAITLVSTEDTPKTLLTVNVAQATDGAIITTRPLTASVTTGNGFRTALTAGRGVNIAKTGGTLTGTTSVTVHIKYRITQS